MAFRHGSGPKDGSKTIVVDMIDPTTGKTIGSGSSSRPAEGNLNVANFGEFQQDGGELLIELLDAQHAGSGKAGVGGGAGGEGDLLGGAFCIPFELDDTTATDGGGDASDWVLAEAGDTSLLMGGVEGNSGLRGEDADMETPGRRAMMRTQTQGATPSGDESQLSVTSEPELTLDDTLQQEQWGAFDPDADEAHVFNDDTLDTNTAAEGGRVSDVELVRAADDSLMSDAQLQRASIAGENDAKGPTVSPGDKSQMTSESFPPFEGATDLPFDDDGSQQPQQGGGGRDSSVLNLSTSTGLQDSRVGDGGSIGGLDMDLSTDGPPATAATDETTLAPKKKKRKPAGPKRMRKRRKIIIDNEKTELTSDHIKDMLRDQSDIVLSHRSHPADWIEDDEGLASSKSTSQDERPLLLRTLPYERLLGRPALGDDGALAPELLNVWKRNAARLEGKPNPIRMRGTAGEEQQRELAEQEVEEAAKEEAAQDVEDVEVGRQGGRDSTDGPPLDGEDQPMPTDDDFPLPDDTPMPPEDFAEMPFDDEAQPLQDEEVGLPQSPDDNRSLDSRGSAISLGAVNDALGEDIIEGEDDPRQAAGSDLVSSTSKWHKHTVKVYNILKQNMASHDRDDGKPDDDEDEEQKKKPSELSYFKLSHDCSRRTAAGVFFELLQLKTWDFIELDQDESYEDIMITPGEKFGESPPAR
eukprot:CAMPEP_0195288398 /NCGR_PEP_ID=MMETSP0707-20130614/5081_1 /TAXON_ID=33640 /ORGANISM="Asterionellopsis glacialis, Strain CCMP134" /LENGTH=695 /DNA_ID=CAMNT_0040348265 /DNA_START=421 /DNA_END=2508 /DNA_ORIENTATION=+